jgi:hypothetical protein
MIIERERLENNTKSRQKAKQHDRLNASEMVTKQQ